MARRDSSIQRIVVSAGFVLLSGFIFLSATVGLVVLPSDPANLEAWFCVLVALLGLASVFDYHRRRRRPHVEDVAWRERVRKLFEHIRYVRGGFQDRDASCRRDDRKPDSLG